MPVKTEGEYLFLVFFYILQTEHLESKQCSLSVGRRLNFTHNISRWVHASLHVVLCSVSVVRNTMSNIFVYQYICF